MTDLNSSYAAEPHALTHCLAVGTYLRLLARGESGLAAAWLDCVPVLEPATMPLNEAGPYSRTPRPVLRLLLRPLSLRSQHALQASLGVLREVVREFSADGEGPLELQATVWVELTPVVPPSSEERVADLLAALRQCGLEGEAFANELDELLAHASIGWSKHSQKRVQHVALRDGSAAACAQLTALLQQLDAFLWQRRVKLSTGPMTDLSFATTAPGPTLVSAAAAAASFERRRWRVGVIVPGGPAAIGDIRDIEEHPDVQCQVRRVYRDDKGTDALFTSAMTAALLAFDKTYDALVIAYGGGKGPLLTKVRAALAPHLEVTQTPCWVAVGHDSDDMEVGNPLVRVCRTPGDARTLFLTETIEHDRRLGAILTAALDRLGHNNAKAVGAETLDLQLRDLAARVNKARDLHLQPMRRSGPSSGRAWRGRDV